MKKNIAYIQTFFLIAVLFFSSAHTAFAQRKYHKSLEQLAHDVSEIYIDRVDTFCTPNTPLDRVVEFTLENQKLVIAYEYQSCRNRPHVLCVRRYKLLRDGSLELAMIYTFLYRDTGLSFCALQYAQPEFVSADTLYSYTYTWSDDNTWNVFGEKVYGYTNPATVQYKQAQQKSFCNCANAVILFNEQQGFPLVAGERVAVSTDQASIEMHRQTARDGFVALWRAVHLIKQELAKK